MKTSDPPVPSDDDTAVACSFLKALLGGCSSGGGGGGGSVSAHSGQLHLGGRGDVGGARLVEQLPMVEASSLQLASSGSGCSGGNP